MTGRMPTTNAADVIESPPQEGVKEAIESIVVALILAFVFRAFIVEAFVIPTGSMAPTLYGAHGTVVCDDCGVEFAYGLRDLSDTRQGISPVLSSSRAPCPNCNHVNTNLRISDERRNPERGDRILVLKWPFDLHLGQLEPQRWQVIVFKDPSDAKTNFIKRLAGLPNEVLMILDGDVYTVPVSELSEPTRAEFEEQVRAKYLFRQGQLRGGVLRSISDRAIDELNRKMRIARKSELAQASLWFRVYNHDYPPQVLDANQPRWAEAAGSESGWDAARPIVTFADQGLPEDYIELRGQHIRADYAYNVHKRRTPPPVADLRVRFVFTPDTPDGRVHVRLDKLGRSFFATIDFDGTVTLSESQTVPTPSSEVMVSKRLPPFVPGRPVRVAFENVDYRLVLSIDGEPVLNSSDDPASPAYYAPDIERLRRMRPGLVTPRIYGEGGALMLNHLVVERDVYYYHSSRHGGMRESWMPSDGWASPDYPILLREGEHFMLGDNTGASKDSRLWDDAAETLTARREAFQLGTVPRDQLIGQAFFVYWPSGHSIRWLPRIGTWNWPMIPDVGRMRWIR